MELGTKVVPKYDKISPVIGTVVGLKDTAITVLWDRDNRKVTYNSGEVREIRPGELEKRIEANKHFEERTRLVTQEV